MQRFYGLHLWRDLTGPLLSYGRLIRLLNQLPTESALHRSLSKGEPVWSTDTYLLATIADATIGANWQRSKDGSKQSKAPKPIPRPGVTDGITKTGGRSQLSPAATKALLDSLKPRKGASDGR